MPQFLSLSPEQEQRAKKLHYDSIVIDGLCYMAASVEDTYLRIMIDAGITATNVTVPEILDNFEQTIRRIADWYASLEKSRDIFMQVLSVDDIHRARAEGRTAIIMGFQDTKPIENELKLIDIFYRLGIRIIQLTYQYRNFVGGGCGEDDPGLSAFGRDLVEKLNDTGILIDLSHCGPKTSMETIELSGRPVAFTHAGLLALCDHVRNKSDELVSAISEKGGLIGFPSYSQFLDIRGNRRPTINEYLDAIDHVVNLSGIDHVGMGFDFTPTWVEEDYNISAVAYPEIYLDYSFQETPVRGLYGVMDSINVTRGLVSRGYSDEDIQKVLGDNFLRVFKQAWEQ